MLDVPTRGFVVRAPSKIDLATAPGLAEALADALTEQGDVVLDCSEVTFCDSTAFRTLLAAKRLAWALQVDLHIAHPPRRLLRVAGILQVNDLLGLPQPLSTDGRA